MTNDAQRLFKLEQMVIKQAQLIAALQQQVGQLAQNQVAAAGGFGGGGGGAAGAFFWFANQDIPAATGSWPSPTPGSITNASIYQSSGASLNFAANATIYNFNFTEAKGPVIPVVSDGAGNYCVYMQEFLPLTYIAFFQQSIAAGATGTGITVEIWNGLTLVGSSTGATLYNPFIHAIGNPAVSLAIPCLPTETNNSFMALAQLTV